MTAIAFLGLGGMGSRMAGRLLGRDYALRVWNRSPAPVVSLVDEGAAAANSPRAAAEGADVVISMVSDDVAARAVWLDPQRGAAAALKPGALAVECSTVTTDWIAELGAAVALRGAALIDAPVAGSLRQAETGKLIFMLGGEANAVERAKPWLQPMAAEFHHLGPLGHGARFKLAVNLLLGTQIAVLAEALGSLARDGFDERAAVEILSAFPVVSPAAANYARMMAERRWEAQFPVDLMAKDIWLRGEGRKGEGTRRADRRSGARRVQGGLRRRPRRGECVERAQALRVNGFGGGARRAPRQGGSG